VLPTRRSLRGRVAGLVVAPSLALWASSCGGPDGSSRQVWSTFQQRRNDKMLAAEYRTALPGRDLRLEARSHLRVDQVVTTAPTNPMISMKGATNHTK
jgi:hypothetical protein